MMLLSLRAVTVRFGGLVANDAVDLDVPEGGVSALLGPNGAGKTTLFNVASGAQRPTSGSVLLAGEDITHLTPQRRSASGMARTFQELALSPALTVRENVLVGLARYRRPGVLATMAGTPSARRRERTMRHIADRALALVGMAGEGGRAASDLPYGARRRLEIARALAAAPRLLLLDEPAAGMGPQESAELAAVVRGLPDQGVTVLLVEHDIGFVRSLASTTTVLQQGKVLATGPTDDVLADPEVVNAYLGTTERVA